jgi:hypothetical protein
MNSLGTSVRAWKLHRSAIAAWLVYFREIDATAFWEFCNTIGTFETCRDVRSLVAIGGKADMGGRPISVAIDPNRTY